MLDFAELAELRPVTTTCPVDQMLVPGRRDHYFRTGLSALWVINSILRSRQSLLSELAPVGSILDVGCGGGRIARFLRVGFPAATIYVSDFRKEDEAWVCTNLGCVPAPEHLPRNAYDLIWLGSVFTHHDQSPARELLARLLAALAPDGVLAFSTHGRFAYRRLKKMISEPGFELSRQSYGLSKENVERLLAQWDESGYGYVPYPGQADYGLTIAPLQWYVDSVTDLADVTQVFLQEKALGEHQDVLAFMNRPLAGRPEFPFLQIAQQIAS
jgi:SAM-dependent methyltransferase